MIHATSWCVKVFVFKDREKDDAEDADDTGDGARQCLKDSYLKESRNMAQ